MAPLTNALIANDDLVTLSTSGFALTLTTGTSYVYVTTGFSNTDAGTFTTVFGGPGTVTDVPEPDVALMMAVDLGALGLARRDDGCTRQPG